MHLITGSQHDKLVANGHHNAACIQDDGETYDFYPVVKLFLPGTGCTWLLTEIDPEEPNLAFGLADLGVGEPELGTIDLNELRNLRVGPFRVERDRHFVAQHPISHYADEARRKGRITV